MEQIDIRFKHKPWISDYITYRNIYNLSIEYIPIEDSYNIKFNKDIKKSFLIKNNQKRHYEFIIPRNEFTGIHIRKREILE